MDYMQKVTFNITIDEFHLRAGDESVQVDCTLTATSESAEEKEPWTLIIDIANYCDMMEIMNRLASKVMAEQRTK